MKEQLNDNKKSLETTKESNDEEKPSKKKIIIIFSIGQIILILLIILFFLLRNRIKILFDGSKIIKPDRRFKMNKKKIKIIKMMI